MTAPTTQAEQEDAVREALIAFLDDRYWQSPEPSADAADALLAGPLATLRTQRDQLAADLRKAAVQISDLAQAKGEAESRLRASEMAGVVEGWREQNERLAADIRKAREEMPETLNTGNLVHDVRTLRMAHDSMHRHAYRWGKAALLLLPFVDMAAGEGLEWIEQDGSPRMDAADLCFAFAEAMGCEFGDAAYTAMLKEGQDKIRTLDQHSLTKNEGGEP